RERGRAVSGTEAIARRVASAETLQSVVTTMKTLASVRIGQYRRSMDAARAADETLELALRAALLLYPELVPAVRPGQVRWRWRCSAPIVGCAVRSTNA